MKKANNKSIAHAVPFPKPDRSDKLTAKSIAHPVQAPKPDRTGALQQKKKDAKEPAAC